MPTRADADDLEELLREHVEDLRQRRWSLTAQKQATQVLPRLFLLLREGGVTDVAQVREAHLVRFVRELAERGLSPFTQATYLAVVKRFFVFAAKRRRLLVDPARELKLPKQERLPRRVLSEGQALRLMKAPTSPGAIGVRDRALLELLYGTGIRLGECLRLDVMDVDLAEGIVFIRDGKGRKDRLVPIVGKAATTLDLYLRDGRGELLEHPGEAALFLSFLGRRLSQTGLQLVVARHADAAGVGAVSPHVLRHTCATHLLRHGADIRQVQELLGHKSLQTTQIYTRVVAQDLRGMLERSHPRERQRRR